MSGVAYSAVPCGHDYGSTGWRVGHVVDAKSTWTCSRSLRLPASSHGKSDPGRLPENHGSQLHEFGGMNYTRSCHVEIARPASPRDMRRGRRCHIRVAAHAPLRVGGKREIDMLELSKVEQQDSSDLLLTAELRLAVRAIGVAL